jgi:hypothetical protein
MNLFTNGADPEVEASIQKRNAIHHRQGSLISL